MYIAYLCVSTTVSPEEIVCFCRNVALGRHVQHLAVGVYLLGKEKMKCVPKGEKQKMRSCRSKQGDVIASLSKVMVSERCYVRLVLMGQRAPEHVQRRGIPTLELRHPRADDVPFCAKERHCSSHLTRIICHSGQCKVLSSRNQTDVLKYQLVRRQQSESADLRREEQHPVGNTRCVHVNVSVKCRSGMATSLS